MTAAELVPLRMKGNQGVSATVSSVVSCMRGPRGASFKGFVCNCRYSAQLTSTRFLLSGQRCTGLANEGRNTSSIVTCRLHRTFGPNRIAPRRTGRVNERLTLGLAGKGRTFIIYARISGRRIRGRVVVGSAALSYRGGFHGF